MANYDESFIANYVVNSDKRLRRLHIHAAGEYPKSISSMMNIIKAFAGNCRDPYTLPYWPGILEDLDRHVPEKEILGWKEGSDYIRNLDFVVLGSERFNKAFLEVCLHYYRFTNLIFVTQEDFFELLQNGVVLAYHHDDPRIAYHPALSFLVSISFTWPSSDGSPKFYNLRQYDGNLAEYSDLRIMGYSVGKNVPFSQRRDALKRCVGTLGLQHVAKKIAWLIRMNKGRWDDKMEDAIDCWEEDLSWLRRSYYENSRYSFIWPDEF